MRTRNTQPLQSLNYNEIKSRKYANTQKYTHVIHSAYNPYSRSGIERVTNTLLCNLHITPKTTAAEFPPQISTTYITHQLNFVNMRAHTYTYSNNMYANHQAFPCKPI